MWVLSTARAELHYFSDCAAVTGGYAISSHTWTQDPAGEQTFQDVQDIIKECKITGKNPRDCVREKIRRFCEIAEADGYEWVWIDSCCIDKTSSTELSEAINSMFNWYALSEVCYVYLEDVEDDDDPRNEISGFQNARWHSRGWSLQELLAPALLIFLSMEWKNIGTKYDLRVPLSQCTGIDEEYLTRKKDFRVHASIATRMSWAATRKTTRVEDEAYCLLGLFGINMPTRYGEGLQAFQRLQGEIIKQNTDATLFAWGGCHCSNNANQEPGPLSEVHRFHNQDIPDVFAFAPSPRWFKGWSDSYSSVWATAPVRLSSFPDSQVSEQYIKGSSLSRDLEDLPVFEVTPYGLRCRVPIAEVEEITIAVLPCRMNGEHLGLVLHPAPLGDGTPELSSRHLYCVSWAFRSPHTGGDYKPQRLACLGNDIQSLCFRGKLFTAEWREIYTMIHPPTAGRKDGIHLLLSLIPDVAPIAFRIPRMLIQTLRALEFFPTTRTVLWDSASKNTIQLECTNTVSVETVGILLGTCTKASTEARLTHWAWAEQRHSATWGQPWREYVHDCAMDHTDDWPNRTREFGDAERTIRLVFAPCTHAPERMLVLSLELFGRAYEEIQKRANIYLPWPIRYAHGRINVAASRTGPTATNSRSFGSALASLPSSSRRPSSINPKPAAAPRTDRLPIVHHSSVNSIAEDLRDLYITNEHPSGADAISALRRELHETLKAQNAAREREIQSMNETHRHELHEMEEAHGAQTRKLIEIIKNIHAEVAQLKEPLNVQNTSLADNSLPRPMDWSTAWGSIERSQHSPAPSFASPMLTPERSSRTQVADTPQKAPGSPSTTVFHGRQAFTPVYSAHAYTESRSRERRDAHYPSHQDDYQPSSLGDDTSSWFQMPGGFPQ